MAFPLAGELLLEAHDLVASPTVKNVVQASDLEMLGRIHKCVLDLLFPKQSASGCDELNMRTFPREFAGQICKRSE